MEEQVDDVAEELANVMADIKGKILDREAAETIISRLDTLLSMMESMQVRLNKLELDSKMVPTTTPPLVVGDQYPWGQGIYDPTYQTWTSSSTGTVVNMGSSMVTYKNGGNSTSYTFAALKETLGIDIHAGDQVDR